MTQRIPIGILVIAAVVCRSTSIAQFNPPTGSLYQERAEKEAYFDQLRSTMTEEEFYEEGGEYAAYERWIRYWEIRSPQGDPANYDLLMKNYCDAKFHTGGSYKSNTDAWHEIGPKRIANNMFGIGPVRHIAISKTDSDHMLCTSNSGGLFYTTDANVSCTWHNAGTDLGLPHSGCNWADYYPGSTVKWYTSSTYGRVSYTGGLYRTGNSESEDEWVRIADYSDLEGPGTQIYQFLFDSKLTANDHRLFLMTSQGLFVTDEPEATDPQWIEVTISPPASIASYSSLPVDQNVLVYDMEYLPSSVATSTLCASMRFFLSDGTSSMNIWRFMISTDNGDSWSEVPNQPTIDPTFEWATIETSAASPTAFHCMVEKGSNSWVKLYDTSTQSWTTLASGFNPDFGAGHTFGVDQFNSNSFIVGDDSYDVNWYLNGVEQVYNYPSSPRQYQYASTGHDDVEDIVGDPAYPGIFWAANHGGVSRINTNGSSRTWEQKCEGLGVAEVWSMSTSQDKPDYVALGLYHQCNVMTRTPYSESWDPDWAYLNRYGDGTLALFDQTDANTLYFATQGSRWYRSDNAETSYTSQSLTGGGQYHAEGALNRKRPERLYRATHVDNGVTDWVNGNGQVEAFTNMEIEIMRSFDKGATGVLISNFANDPEVSHSSINEYKFDNELFWWIRPSPANSSHLYVGIRNFDWQHRIYRTTMVDHPSPQSVINSWVEVPHPRRVALGTLQRDEPPVGFTLDPEDENTVYIAYSSSLFEDPIDYASLVGRRMVFKLDVSDLNAFPQTEPFDCDGTYPCSDLTMNLPNTIVDLDCFTFEQGSDGGLYLATEVGTYFTDNKRITSYDSGGPYVDPDDLNNTSGWVRLGGSLPHVKSHGLEINYNVNRIRTGLTGRGVWEHGLHCPSDIDLYEMGTYIAGTFLEAQASITSEAVVPTDLKVNYRGGSEVHLSPGFHATEGSSFHAFIHPCDMSGNSFQPKSMPDESGTDMNDATLQDLSGSLLLYPNPTRGALSLLCASLGDEDNTQIFLFDAMGREVLSRNMRGKSTVLDVSSLKGLFTVVLNTGVTRFVGRLVVE